jgi:hypothetical protein
LEKGSASPDASQQDINQSIRHRYQDMLESLFVKRRFSFFSQGFAHFLAQSAGAALGRAETMWPSGIY